MRAKYLSALMFGVFLLAAVGCQRKIPPRLSAREADWSIALRALASIEQGQRQAGSGSLFGVSLEGYSHHQIFDSGRMEKFLILIFLDHGCILVFREDGSFAASGETRQIESVMAVELGADGHTQLIVGQLDAYGTGVSWRNYYVYVLSGKSLEEYPVGELRVIEAAQSDRNGNPIVEKDILGFIHIGDGRRAASRTIIHVSFDAKRNKYSQTAYQLRDGRIEQIPVPPTLSSSTQAKRAQR